VEEEVVEEKDEEEEMEYSSWGDPG